MSIQVHCPNPTCTQTGSVPDSYKDRTIRCPQCRQRFSVQESEKPNRASTTRMVLNHQEDTVESNARRDNEFAKEKESAPKHQASIVPDRISRFRIHEKLGAGAFGAVYRAYDPQLERVVALKVPRPGALDNLKRTERFFREAKSAAQLRHPHIVPVFEAGHDGDLYYIASAYIAGQTLSAAREKRIPDRKKVVSIVRELAEALDYAHRNGIVHRDVKSANIMIDGRGHPHLMDFGIAHREDDVEKLTHEGSVIGTPAYMAPEQAQGQSGDPLPASDQYSLGVVLYELLCGELPFVGKPELVLFHAINTDPQSPREIDPTIPRDLETICLKSMAKNPEDRYASCQEMADDLRRWHEGEPIRARRLGWAERFLLWCRREPKMVIAGAMVFVCLLIVALTSSISWATVASSREKVRAALRKNELFAENLKEERWAKLNATEKAKLLALYLNDNRTELDKLSQGEKTTRQWLKNLDGALDQLNQDKLIESAKQLKQLGEISPDFPEAKNIVAQVTSLIQKGKNQAKATRQWFNQLDIALDHLRKERFDESAKQLTQIKKGLPRCPETQKVVVQVEALVQDRKKPPKVIVRKTPPKTRNLAKLKEELLDGLKKHLKKGALDKGKNTVYTNLQKIYELNDKEFGPFKKSLDELLQGFQKQAVQAVAAARQQDNLKKYNQAMQAIRNFALAKQWDDVCMASARAYFYASPNAQQITLKIWAEGRKQLIEQATSLEEEKRKQELVKCKQDLMKYKQQAFLNKLMELETIAKELVKNNRPAIAKELKAQNIKVLIAEAKEAGLLKQAQARLAGLQGNLTRITLNYNNVMAQANRAFMAGRFNNATALYGLAMNASPDKNALSAARNGRQTAFNQLIRAKR
ncbi:MAG: protein kinase [Gemmataceae bacterium]